MAYDVYISGRPEPIRIEADDHRYNAADKTRRFILGSRRVATFIEEKIEGVIDLNPEDDGESKSRAAAGAKMVG